MEEKKIRVQTKYFSCVVYLEHFNNCVADLITAINKLDVIEYYCISPVHDQDMYDKDKQADLIALYGDYKKPHYHIVFKTLNIHDTGFVSKRLFTPINEVHKVGDLRHCIRYLVHYDEDPNEKAIYNHKHIISSGIDYQKYFVDYVPVGDRYDIINLIVDVIAKKHIVTFRALLHAFEENLILQDFITANLSLVKTLLDDERLIMRMMEKNDKNGEKV